MANGSPSIADTDWLDVFDDTLSNWESRIRRAKRALGFARKALRGRVHFGSPQELAGEPFLSWWHIPVSLSVPGGMWSRTHRECSVTLMFHDKRRGRFAMGVSLEEGARRSFTLVSAKEPVMIPVALRASQANPTFPTECVVTDHASLFPQWNFSKTLPAGEHEFRLVLEWSDARWTSPSYVLTVPGPGMDNGHFRITRYDKEQAWAGRLALLRQHAG